MPDADPWEIYSRLDPLAKRQPVGDYGPGQPTEQELRLVGVGQGRRILELGCGEGRSLVAFARAGAIAIGIDPSADKLASARALAEREKVRLELRQGDLAELAFIGAETVDAALSSHVLSQLPDLRRVFRQVHRVLKPGAPLVFSVRHPLAGLVDKKTRILRRSYFDDSPVSQDAPGDSEEYNHTFSYLFMTLTRSGYRVDTVVEPEPQGGETVASLIPQALVIRARKEGL